MDAATAALLAAKLDTLSLRRLGSETEAGLCTISLPWPAVAPREVSLGGRPTWNQPLGQWPSCSVDAPRRMLLIADSGGASPAELKLGAAAPVKGAVPTSEMEKFAEYEDLSFGWERHRLRIRHGDRTIALALGLTTGGEIHWWEACGMTVLSESPTCREVLMSGSIPRDLTTHEALLAAPGYRFPLLHHHHWLSGQLYVRLHANGVVEVYAHHINSKFFDDGLDLEDVVPVIGIASDEGEALVGAWDGTVDRFTLDGVRFDVTEAARLATPAQPGRISREDGFTVWQPYAGVDVYGGVCPKELSGDAWLWHAEQHVFPRGMARTVRFSLSLGDRSPRIARYLAPYWWYGACEELYPASLLPVSNAYDERLDQAAAWIRLNIKKGGFDDGSVPRHAPLTPTEDPTARYEAGWEGEIPRAQFLNAYRSGNVEDYLCAVRSTYHFTDVAVDHAVKLVRMHGFRQPTIAQPMNRVIGTLTAYLETGDPYLFHTAEAITETAYRLHQNSWPRSAVGRDACFVRGAIMLYRYFANDHFRRIAADGCRAVCEVQRADGSFGDQGGGAGVHQNGAFITKPWMGMLATSPLLDYIQLFPGDEAVALCLRRFGDWLMANRWERDGFTGWSYQHNFRGQHRYFDFYHARWLELPAPGQWHQDNLARLLGWCTLDSGNPAYLDAFAESYARIKADSGDHSTSASLQFLPWLQAKLWQARLTAGGIALKPLHFGPRTPAEATILGPDGPLKVIWQADGTVAAPKGVRLS